MKKLLSTLVLTAALAATALAGRNDTFTGKSIFETGSLTIKSGVTTVIDGTVFTLSAGAKTALQTALSIQPVDPELTGWAAKVPYDGRVAVTANKTFTATGNLTIAGTDGKTLTISNNLTLAGTDNSTLTIGSGGTLGTAALVDRTTLMPAFVAVPGSATANGTAGTMAYGNGTLYICIDENIWQKVTIDTW